LIDDFCAKNPMNKTQTISAVLFFLALPSLLVADLQSSIARGIVFQEEDGTIAVEAEHFLEQTKTEQRSFFLTTKSKRADVTPDGDPSHIAGASGGAYLEILPDTRRTHGDKLIKGENFSPEPGQQAVLSYQVHFQTPGRYYVWVRAYSTGSEDNGLHVGINGKWPASGQRLQWCDGKNSWRWDSKQRTEKIHCGEPGKIYLDINEAGVHTIQFSMREDGFEFDKWLMTTDKDFSRPTGLGANSAVRSGKLPEPFTFVAAKMNAGDRATPTLAKNDENGSRSKTPNASIPVSKVPLMLPRKRHGNGRVTISGEQKQWHNITFTFDGRYAHEQDNAPNPFTDYRFGMIFTSPNGKKWNVPGYFAADGNAAETSAVDGTKWRVHFAPDEIGEWKYSVIFQEGENAAIDAAAEVKTPAPYQSLGGTFNVEKTDKQGRDLRAHGRLQYVGKRYLQFAGSGQYFLKAGADAPETLLGYADFDNTIAGNPKKVQLKTWQPHVQDWKTGDPTWQDGKGKGLIGAVNYLSGKGCNAFSFLTYNAGGDGDNVWPFIQREDKLHYDCSKLDQWGIVFEHGTHRGMYLHFKLQETENDDNRLGKRNGIKPEALDGGELGPQRKLYLREMIARYGHNLALNWNLGEENTQSTEEQQAMLNYIAELDPYHHNRVLHTYPSQQEAKYRPLIGDRSKLTGLSLQNSNIADTHSQTVKWIHESTEAGKPWIVAFDESGSAAHAQCPDLGYKGFDGHDKTGKMTYTEHEVRQQTLWGHFMAGGAGVEYYFGYQYVENDLICEDWRSRDRSWDYCRLALEFFHDNNIPFWEMTNHDELVSNVRHDNSAYCFSKTDEVYLVYLPNGKSTKLNLSQATGDFSLSWYNPRTGGELQLGSVASVIGGGIVQLGQPPSDATLDWLAVIRKSRDIE